MEASEALNRLRKTDPPVWLTPNGDLSHAVRVASQYLFDSLKPHSPKSPFDRLLIDGFDAEQIWQQIDLQSRPLLSSLRREVNKFEKNPEEIGKLLNLVGEKESKRLDGDDDDDEDMEMDMDGLDDEGDEDDEELENENDQGKQEDGIESGGDEEAEEDEERGEGGIEDKFFKIKELREYLEEDEAEELGLKKKKKKDDQNKEATRSSSDDSEDEDEDGEAVESDEGEDEDEEENDELGALGDDDGLETARYGDFFGAKKNLKRKSAEINEGDDMDKGNVSMSTHEKELKEIQSKIERMEKANLEPKDWTMQGEVTAAKRPKNSALEVDLDFDHNVRPAPVITDEVTASLEDMIKNRIIEGNFNDVQRAPSLSLKAPRELKELDDSKSKKGLAEVYEEEYAQKTNLAPVSTSFSEELKKEADTLFKKLCFKLDALSHFHFTPKPVIEDMSIQANVPALAMEEIAPLAVSDAAMLAPEEIFAGKGNIKEETELTKAERKRRRAKKKRRFKAESAKRIAKKAQTTTVRNQYTGKAERE